MGTRRIDQTLEIIRTALETDRVEDALQAMYQLKPADQAETFSHLDETDQATLLAKLNLATTADLLEKLKDEIAADVADHLPTELLADILDEMEPDEAADILGDLSPEKAAKALAKMEVADEVIPLLAHGDETAGGLMTTSFIALRPSSTATAAIEVLRNVKPNIQIPYYLYVEDDLGRLIGVVGLRQLVIADPNDLIDAIMDRNVIFTTTEMDQEDVARMIARYDLAALPVVDDDGILLGVVTHDDVVDVISEEATEDIYRLANVGDTDLTILSPVSMAVKQRLPWLYLSALTALFAAWVISHFEAIIAQVALLAVFQSVVAGMGGNAATQSLAMVVRAIALGDIAPGSGFRIVLKEAVTGLLQGIFVGTVVGLGVYLWKGNAMLGVILGMALVGNMLVAVIVGTAIPLLLKAVRLDPALASSVLVTAVTDSLGFFLFLGLATIFLPYL